MSGEICETCKMIFLKLFVFRLVQNIANCMADAIEEDCGTNLINDVRDFISAHIGCGNPTG